MKSRFAGTCSICATEWGPGEPISKWLGRWAHEGCKAARAASMAAGGARTVLPDARGTADKEDNLVRTKGRGHNFRSHVM